MNFMNKREVLLILKQLQVNPKRHLGQNFLVDNNIVNKIVDKAEVLKKDVILEIGPGLGALTERLVEKAKKIHAIEIDTRLYSYLKEKFSTYKNIEIINDDILQADLPSFNKVVSNIPYSITGPIFEKVFYKKNPPSGILVIEKSISNRIFNAKNYKNFSRITITSNAFMIPVERFDVSRMCFYPTPKIDLSLIKIEPRNDKDHFLRESISREFFLKFIARIMPYKGKNISNAIYQANIVNLEKGGILQVLRANNYKNEKLWGLKIEDFIKLSKIFFDLTLK